MADATKVETSFWGSLPGEEAVALFTLKNDVVEISLTSYGARITSVRTKDRAGAMGEITLGSDKLSDFVEHHRTFMGAICGRVSNRIAEGKFTLDGVEYQLPINNGPNSLHGGTVGFDQQLWSASQTTSGVRFTYVSPAGEMGYPGTLTVSATYALEGAALRLDYEATTDAATVVNLTNHVFWNLAGDGGDLAAHKLKLHADAFTPVTENLIPTGELKPVEGTVFDFRLAKPVGRDWNAEDEQLKRARGFDHNWVLRGSSGALSVAAELFDPATGRTLTVETTEPGIQFYAGNFLDGRFPARTGGSYGYRSGLCLETQHFPNSPNLPQFPSTVLRPGETLQSTTVFRFGVGD
jgi:aldose 1-epimerase